MRKTRPADLDVRRFLSRQQQERVERLERENAEIKHWDWNELHDVCARDMAIHDNLPPEKRKIVHEKDFKGLRKNYAPQSNVSATTIIDE